MDWQKGEDDGERDRPLRALAQDCHVHASQAQRLQPDFSSAVRDESANQLTLPSCSVVMVCDLIQRFRQRNDSSLQRACVSQILAGVALSQWVSDYQFLTASSVLTSPLLRREDPQ